MHITDFKATKKQTKVIEQKLIPIGKTEEAIKEYKLLEGDFYIAKNKETVNEILKMMASEHITTSLKDFDYDFTELFELMGLYQETKEKALGDALFKKRVEIADLIGKLLGKRKFTSRNTIIDELPKFINDKLCNDKKYEEYLELACNVKDYQARFNKFEEIIDNKLSSKMAKGNLVYRVIFENADFYEKNNKKIAMQKDFYSIVLENDILEIVASPFDAYNNYLTQETIEKYNKAVGEANFKINEHCQKNKLPFRAFELSVLYNQIFSNKTAKIEVLENDEQVLDIYNTYIKKVNDIYCKDSLKYFSSLTDKDLSLIFVKGNRLSDFSKEAYGVWYAVENCLLEYYKEYAKGKTDEKKLENAKKMLSNLKKNSISIEFINSVVEKYCDILEDEVKDKNIADCLEPMYSKFSLADKSNNAPLKDDKSFNAQLIKKELEKLLNVRQFINIFDDGMEDKEYDYEFVDAIKTIKEAVNESYSVYNKIRNYINKRPSKNIKTTLTFESPSFGGGWSSTIEDTKLVTLFKKNDKKYLGIYNKKKKGELHGVNLKSTSALVKYMYSSQTDSNEDSYEKLVLNIIGDVKKALPKNLIYPKAMNAPEHIVKGVKEKKHIEDVEFLHEVIKYCIEAIREYENYSVYDFNFREPDEYESWDEFCADVQRSDYSINWINIPSRVIDELVENEYLLLFEIYNNDFSKAKRTNNKKVHTQYLNYLFDEENVKTHLVRLNGGLEVFFRPAQIENPYIHKAGSKLVGKKYKNGKAVENYPEVVKDVSSGMVDENLKVSTAKYDIIKDRRYTRDQFEMHMSLTIGADMDLKPLNERAKYFFVQEPNVLVIKRGVRNLLYALVMDKDENILYSESLNVLNNCDYAELITRASKQKTDNMKNWKTVGSSDNLKDGYISCAVKKVADLMLEYNAVLVLEDIGENIKVRTSLDNQVFAKFENAIVRKLSNIVNKNVAPNEEGGALFPYAVCDEAINTDKKKQNGLLLLAGSAYSAAIDQRTGFVNRFNFANFRTIESKKSMLEKFTSFTYGNDLFVLTFAYSDFGIEMPTDYWRLDSHGNRVVKFKSKKTGKVTYENLDLTSYIKDKFAEQGIDYKNGENLLSVDGKKVNAVFEAITLIFKMVNEFEDVSYVISPASDYCTSTINGKDYNSCITLAKRGYLLMDKAVHEENLYVKNKDYLELAAR